MFNNETCSIEVSFMNEAIPSCLFDFFFFSLSLSSAKLLELYFVWFMAVKKLALLWMNIKKIERRNGIFLSTESSCTYLLLPHAMGEKRKDMKEWIKGEHSVQNGDLKTISEFRFCAVWAHWMSLFHFFLLFSFNG